MQQECKTIIVENPKLPLNEIERSLIKTYKKDIFRPFVQAINEYNLIQPGDKIAVGISGGKDSLILAKLFQELKRHNKIPFELVFLAMDPGFRQVNKELLLNNCSYLDIPVVVKESEIFDVIGKIAKENPCYMCARMRRGFLYKAAKDLGCNKLALGHHKDDVIETTLLNIFYNGAFMTMVPKIQAENFEDIELIRPMMFVREKDIIRWIKHSGIQAMNCGCTVVAEKTSSKRREIKELIENLRKVNPDVDQQIFNSATNVNLEAILGYRNDTKRVHFNELYDERRKKK
ncbi:tRNA 2-thiocytidine biosynthesis TtcA family protein [Peloplasma aerotolerans]|uniref:ATP-binding protein n=1 Tax=Peloplasma aerotolerans TaxID=3044389 RepID=A0AAW6U6N3_9MOLU|nr:ATP-binding protein [Mariniplasma sp. M4Ah]MDI6452187.1 ATP-binding protein [Mariniplasma sp. M4Ah]MDR4968327.1 ATP-binding protein [Acholeplasmataceae bacterium]